MGRAEERPGAPSLDRSLGAVVTRLGSGQDWYRSTLSGQLYTCDDGLTGRAVGRGVTRTLPTRVWVVA